MLSEATIRQRPGETMKRWFTDEMFDLIVWDGKKSIDRFQLCYDIADSEKALSWSSRGGYVHNRIDDGEGTPLKNQTPILDRAGVFDKGRILKLFQERSATVPKGIAEFVVKKIAEYQG